MFLTDLDVTAVAQTSGLVRLLLQPLETITRVPHWPRNIVSLLRPCSRGSLVKTVGWHCSLGVQNEHSDKSSQKKRCVWAADTQLGGVLSVERCHRAVCVAERPCVFQAGGLIAVGQRLAPLSKARTPPLSPLPPSGGVTVEKIFLLWRRFSAC